MSFCFVSSLFAQNSSSKDANRRTALRYLSLAKNYVNTKDYDAALKSCQSGINYDDTISDLWYLQAICLYNQDSPRFKILPVIKKSLTNTQWVDYNMTNARVFYADLLCSTGNPLKALETLDEKPLVLSSDAEYIRIKSYYQLGDEKSVAKARERIDAARRVYPSDVRFFYMFFNYEYNLLYTKSEDGLSYIRNPVDPLAMKIAASFIKNVPMYDKEYKDLELFAATFAQGEEQVRLLKAYNARGFKHILYPVAALEAGILNQEEALDYFLEFIEGSIDIKLLDIFYSKITEENLRSYFNQHLDAFKGKLVYDTNNNLETNLLIEYERGRAQKIIFDYNNDGFVEWEAECDFGAPKSLAVYDQKAAVAYFNYPDVVKITFVDLAAGFPKGDVTYSIIDNEVACKPFEIVKDSVVLGTDFFVVDENSLSYGTALFDPDKILAASNQVEHASWERPGATIRFSLLNGIPHNADYYADGKIYAHADFLYTNEEYVQSDDYDICVIRNIDLDGDGNLEVTQYYSVAYPGMKQDPQELASITTALWGCPVPDANIYLSRVEIDTDYNTVVDYVQQYDKDGKITTYWDKDEDGEWEVCSQKFPVENGIEKSLDYYKFIDVVKNNMQVCLERHNEIPVSLMVSWRDADGEEVVENLSVEKGTIENFYWVGSKGTAGQEKNILGIMNGHIQGRVFSMEEPDEFLHIIEMGRFIFVRRIPKTALSIKSQMIGEEAQD